MPTILTADDTGSVTLPADLCRAAGVAPGTNLVAQVQSGRIVLESAPSPFWERIAAFAADAPQQELDKVPRDGAAEADHYLYGHPKRG
jgi:antitoxin component of MazEF toxin-antitoxin module